MCRSGQARPGATRAKLGLASASSPTTVYELRSTIRRDQAPKHRETSGDIPHDTSSSSGEGSRRPRLPLQVATDGVALRGGCRWLTGRFLLWSVTMASFFSFFFLLFFLGGIMVSCPAPRFYENPRETGGWTSQWALVSGTYYTVPVLLYYVGRPGLYTACRCLLSLVLELDSRVEVPIAKALGRTDSVDQPEWFSRIPWRIEGGGDWYCTQLNARPPPPVPEVTLFVALYTMADTGAEPRFGTVWPDGSVVRFGSPFFRPTHYRVLGCIMRKAIEGRGGNVRALHQPRCFSPQPSSDAASTPTDLQECKELLHLTRPAVRWCVVRGGNVSAFPPGCF
ncbi:hypothetical protein LZ30DRAFT_149659 [Colletotrichum cereale]|nr:hypothetical protein LZ30DRAFT_149659 [Colletotrichum cereale]